MNRKQRFVIAIASAIITIGVLFAAIGKPKYLDKHNHRMECSKSVENK